MGSRALERHISGVYTTILMGFLVETMPAERVKELLRRAAEARSIDELSDVGSWSSYRQFRRLLEERFRLDGRSLHEQADTLGQLQSNWEMSQSARTLGSPGELIAGGSDANPLVPIRRYDKTQVAPNEWIIRERFEAGYEPFPEFCDFVAIQYALIPMIFGMAPGEVTEEECQCRSDGQCLFRIRWQPHETDAQEMEQYRARAELAEIRLGQVQEMITALASNEQHEDILQGFVGSLLRTALGAGGALLVLEARPGAAKTIYSEGFAGADVEAIADDLLARGDTAGNLIAVEVASARHHYGYLAVDEGGAVLPELTHATLETYGRLAAAALDTARALEEARHQANTSKILLDLATSLTEIVSSEETAANVVKAVPDLIDCDRAAIFLNSSDPLGTHSDDFRLAGSTGLTKEEVARVSSQSGNAPPPDLVEDLGIERTTFSGLGNVASVSSWPA